jgi:hypothetical protein
VTGGLTARNDTPFGKWQDRFDWFRDVGFLEKQGTATKAAFATGLPRPTLPPTVSLNRGRNIPSGVRNCTSLQPSGEREREPDALVLVIAISNPSPLQGS